MANLTCDYVSNLKKMYVNLFTNVQNVTSTQAIKNYAVQILPHLPITPLHTNINFVPIFKICQWASTPY
jgi:hypothetical protein